MACDLWHGMITRYYLFSWVTAVSVHFSLSSPRREISGKIFHPSIPSRRWSNYCDEKLERTRLRVFVICTRTRNRKRNLTLPSQSENQRRYFANDTTLFQRMTIQRFKIDERNSFKGRTNVSISTRWCLSTILATMALFLFQLVVSSPLFKMQ